MDLHHANIGPHRLAYVDEGRGEALLLIHGLAGDHQAWNPQIAAWRQRWRVIAPDTRGAGASSQTADPVTIEELADDFIGLLDRLDVERVHVVGRSMGGCIGQWLALKQPRRVASLTLLASCGKFDPLALRCLANMREVLELTRSWAVHARHSVPNFVSPAFFNGQPDRVAAIEALIGSSTRLIESYVQQNHAVCRHDLLDRLGEIRCPVLVMSGSVDPLGGPLLTRWMLERLEHARHVQFAGCSHFFLMERPEDFMREMERWLLEQAPVAA
jgi:3-oxoadipate enol-lactonase